MTTTIKGSYGEAPGLLGYPALDWDEFMSWLYLPVRLAETGPDGYGFNIPPQLDFARDLIDVACLDIVEHYSHLNDPYIYVTAKRGWASGPGALNRPGWHTDGFGTDDINYVWWDGDEPTMGTHYAVQQFDGIEPNDAASLRQFEQQARASLVASSMSFYRLTPYVVHRAPMHFVEGMRSFLKLSFSNHRYNLIGNSRNHGLDYDWTMHPRSAARNDPSRAADFVEEGQ